MASSEPQSRSGGPSPLSVVRPPHKWAQVGRCPSRRLCTKIALFRRGLILGVRGGRGADEVVKMVRGYLLGLLGSGNHATDEGRGPGQVVSAGPGRLLDDLGGDLGYIGCVGGRDAACLPLGGLSRLGLLFAGAHLFKSNYPGIN